MSKLTCISAVLVVSGLLAGCDPATSPGQMGESPADALPQGADTGSGTAEQGLSVISQGSWSGTGWNSGPVVDLGSASDRVCFLNKMTGDFGNASNTIITSTLFGRWFVGGNATWPGVGAHARCVSVPGASSYGQEYSWVQGNPAVNLGTAAGRVCFLTEMQGLFGGGGEHVETYVSAGNWYLGGGSMQWGVGAKARCISVPSYSGTYSWYQGMGPVRMDSSDTTRACVLTRVTGRFGGVGESVEIYSSGGAWYLGGASQQVDLGATAVCF
jgi:hypothetical protein